MALAGLVALGTLLLWLPPCGQNRQLTLLEALFTAVSALATTGLTIITPGADLSVTGQCVLLVLMQAGGVGYMVLAVIVFSSLGRRVSLADRMILRDSLGLISAASVLRLARRVLLWVMLIELVGALLLTLLWYPRYGAKAAYLAIFHSVSAFCNASFDLMSGTPTAPAAFPQDTGTLLVLSSLVILGSIGIPVLSDIWLWPRGLRPSLHTRLTLATAAILLGVGTLMLYLGFSNHEDLFSDLPWHRRLLLAWFHSATARTSGFVLQDLSTMDPSSVLVLSGLMFIGGSPASMGGGITTSTFAVLALALLAYVRGREDVTFSGRTLPRETIAKAASILVLAGMFVGLVAWLLMLTNRVTLSEGLFEAVSAFSTCGFTLGITTKLNLFGQLLLCFTMFCGRLGVLTVVVALANPSRSAIAYPEEKVLIG